MPLNEAKGNMYSWLNYTWNTVKGECPHGCTYCYMKRFGKQKPVRFDESELKTDLGTGNFIFVGSSCDLFANDVPDMWIRKTLSHCEKYDSKYLFQSKNPWRILDYIDACVISDKSVVCTTMETNRFYPDIMKQSPPVSDRSFAMHEISKVIKTYITIEPIMDFDLDDFIITLKNANPTQVNIGFNTSYNIQLPEPDEQKTIELITELRKFTKVKLKSNSQRVIKDKSLYL